MNTPTRVTAFVGGLAAVFAAALGVGTVAGPIGSVTAASTGSSAGEPAGHDADHADPGTTEPVAADLPGGLMVSQDGYTLAAEQRQLPPSAKAPLQFQILGPDGQPVTRYTTSHGKDLHLVVVRRDLTDYQHVHPSLDATGTWSVPLDLSDPGAYRLFADFTPADRGDNLTLGSDLSVAGKYEPQPLPVESRTAEVDGYTVTLDGSLEPGREAELTLSVTRDGQPVTDLQPYLEAYGHLVALRDRDLAYLHVHPAGAPGDGQTAPGPGITFYANVPSAGSYRLFLDFRHGDQVRTAAFTVTAGPAGRVPRPADAGSSGASPSAAPSSAAPSSAAPSPPAPSGAQSTGAEDDHGHGG